ncbi:MAG: hypothetical protein WBF35_05570 [Candidatus Acidiferrales bacterium]
MATSDRDPESEKRKDKAFDRVLAEAFSAEARKDCPDAETLAAFYERALAPAETAHWREHFTTCSRCQQALAAMAASDPNPLAAKEIEHLGESVAATAWLRRVLKWPRYLDPRTLAPLAAAAVLVVALWFTAHPPATSPSQIALEYSVAPPAPEPLVAENKAAPSPPPESYESSPSSSALQQSSRAPLPRLAMPRSAPVSPAPPAQSASAAPEQSQSAPSGSEEQSVPQVPAASESREQSASDSTASSGVAGGIGSGSGAAAGGAVAGGTPAPNSAPEQARGEEETASAGATNEAIATVAPTAKLTGAIASFGGIVAAAQSNSLVVWQFGRNGYIARSTDSGATWTPQSSPVHTDLLAGSAPSETICWLVGRRGAILRSVDGIHWQLVPSPPQAEQNSQPPDWTWIEAHDALSAVVGTKDGRRFSTSDAGKTWQPQ